MDQDFGIIRCPACGGTDLQALYDESVSKKMTKRVLWHGLLGLLYHKIKSRNETDCFWQCKDCGNIFPM